MIIIVFVVSLHDDSCKDEIKAMVVAGGYDSGYGEYGQWVWRVLTVDGIKVIMVIVTM